MTETPKVLSANGTRTTSGTTVLIAAPTKQWHWRSLPTGTAGTGTALGTHSTTTLQQDDTIVSGAWKGYRISKTHAGVTQQAEITDNDTNKFTFSGGMADAPVDTDPYTLEPPVGYRAVMDSFTVSWGDDWGSDGTIIIQSLNTVGATVLETINVANGAGGSVAESAMELYGVVHGNLQFTTSQNGTVSVTVTYRWVKLGSTLQYG